MSAPLHSSPAVGFDDPFDLLAACHDRVERMLTLLERLADHLGKVGCDAQARQAAVDVMRYFDFAAPLHHEDEERHVFPLLQRQGDAAMQALVIRLLTEHELMAASWRVLRKDLNWVATSHTEIRLTPEDLARWATFVALCRQHIATEDRHVYPVACALADEPTQMTMGTDMAVRRGAR